MEQLASAYQDKFPYYTIDAWVDQRFIFLPTPKSQQEYSYQMFVRGKNPDVGEAIAIPYIELAERIAVVTQVRNKKISSKHNLWNVILRMVDDGSYYSTVGIEGVVHDIAFFSDIEAARELWLGPSLWSIQGRLLTYNEMTENTDEFFFRKFSEVKVIDIVPNWHQGAPVKFIVETEDNKIGYLAVHLSDTNISEKSRKYNKLENAFLTADPKVVYPWNAETWNALENRQTQLRMTRQQVQLSIGTPPKIENDANGVERWGGYKDESVYFSFVNGVLEEFHR